MTTTLTTLQTKLQRMMGDTNGVYADKYLNAINDAARETYPVLFKTIKDETLIAGNSLPNSHFEDWDATTIPNHYTLSNSAALATTTAGLYRGGAKSMKVTASAADGYVYITSNDWGSLLDLMGKTITFKAWAYPEEADDAFLTIYTIKADGTEQTLNSTTACPAGKWTLLKLENQSINADIVEIQFRFRVHTDAKYAYFDNSRVTGRTVYEYLLPTDLQDGNVSQVWLQNSGYSDDACDDIGTAHERYSEVFGWHIDNDGTYRYLTVPYSLVGNRKIMLIGDTPLEDDLSLNADTISLEGEKVNLLLTYAAYLVYTMQSGVVSSDSTNKFDKELAKWLGKYEYLKPKMRMTRPRSQISWSI